jgi:glutathione synthase
LYQLLEHATLDDRRQIMASINVTILSEDSDGDKRVLVVNGRAIAPHALARIPAQGETRGSLAAGGRGWLYLSRTKGVDS